MAFPSQRDFITKDDPNTSTTVLVDLPATVEPNDLLIAFLVLDGSVTIDTAGGWDQTSHGTWTNLATTGTGGGTHATHIWAKVAAGNEDSGQLSMTISAAETGCSRVICVQDWKGTIDGVGISTVAEANDTSPNPNVSPTVALDDNLFIAWFGHDNGNLTTTGFPTGYGTTAQNQGGGAGGAGEAIAFLASQATSDNPDSFTLSATAQWDAYTLVVEPASSGAASLVGRHGANRGIIRGAARGIG